MEQKLDKVRYVAQIVIEAESPLKVGGSNRDIFMDSPIQKDWNGLPMILGSSIAGVLREAFSGDYKLEDELFGFKNRKDGKSNKKEEFGSRVLISNAHLLDENGKVIEGFLFEKNDFLKHFETLPVREHTAITSKGVARKHSKFDEEVVYKGSRFKFEMEFIAESKDENHQKEKWEKVMKKIASPMFRLGSGTTKGFGKLKVVSLKHKAFDLSKKEDKELYLEKSSSLNYELKGAKDFTEVDENVKNYIHYKLELTPDSTFLFGSGFGDEESDMTPVLERVVKWINRVGRLMGEEILMPASSIKGALSHRVAFHYNKIKGVFSDSFRDKDEHKRYVGENNEAVKAIFGCSKDSKDIKEITGRKDDGAKGRVVFTDIYQSITNFDRELKVFDHVKIDRFTGGAMDGALFKERVVYKKDVWSLDIYLKNDKPIEKDVLDAFENALKDLCSGLLPLGGATTKGHGVFTGNFTKE